MSNDLVSILRTNRIKSILTSVVCTTPELTIGTYSTTLTFDTDQDIYHDATGESITFTLGANGVNGVGIILRLNKPTAVSFPGTFEASSSSVAFNAANLNVCYCVFYTNWNGSGLDHVTYRNELFTAQ